MREFARFINILPLSGKITIRPLVYRFYQSTTETERGRRYLHLVVIIAFSILLHAVQAKMGIQALNFNAPTWAKAISGIYALTNICVVLTQIYLGFRATIFSFKGLYPRTKRSHPDYTGVQVIVMLAVTLGGQIVFFLIYSSYN
jgi:hypothetical protein